MIDTGKSVEKCQDIVKKVINNSLISLFMSYSQIAYQTEQLLKKKFSDLMLGLESDKMTPVWPNDIFTLTFYATFPNNIPNWGTFV